MLYSLIKKFRLLLLLGVLDLKLERWHVVALPNALFANRRPGITSDSSLSRSTIGSSPGMNNNNQVYVKALTVIDNFNPEEQQKVDDESTITDEHVLLALRSYLVRKHKLPWREKIKRYQDAVQWSRTYIPVVQQQQSQCTPSVTTSSYSDSPVGYFWHDPTELKFLDNQPLKNESYIVTNYRSEEGLRVHYSSASQQDYNGCRTSGAIEDGIDASRFTSFDTQPDDTYVRRSIIAQKMWSNEEFRKKWWTKRWGDRSRSQKSLSGRHLSDKLGKIPSEILRSDVFQRALFELGDEELTNITKSYISSNQKRSDAARRHKLELDLSKSMRSNTTTDNIISSYTNDLRIGRKQFEDRISEEGQRESQRKRSEKARLSYQTRLARRQQLQQKQPSVPNDLSRTSSLFNTSLSYDSYSSDLFNEVIATSSLKEKLFAPTYGQMSWLKSGDIEKSELLYQESFINSKKFTASLNANIKNISASDLILLLKPKRLVGRKQLLLRILKERFNLIGKCVPVEGGKKAFATHSSIKQLGDFVFHLLMKEQKQC